MFHKNKVTKNYFLISFLLVYHLKPFYESGIKRVDVSVCVCIYIYIYIIGMGND